MAHDIVDLLLEQIDRLKLQHRAGITPPAGDIDQLFDLAADARRMLGRDEDLTHTAQRQETTIHTAPAAPSPYAPPSSAVATGGSARVVVEGQPDAVAQTIRAIARGRRAA